MVRLLSDRQIGASRFGAPRHFEKHMNVRRTIRRSRMGRPVRWWYG